MKSVEPIRDTAQIEALKRELLMGGYRNFLVFVIGIYTGLRVSDILKLKVCDVAGKTHLDLVEKKTGKNRKTLIKADLKEEIAKYIGNMNPDDYLFKSQKGKNKPISRVQYWRILNDSAKAIGIPFSIGTHTMRKTFGFHLYQKTKDIALIQNLLNHSSPSITLRYIGINNDLMDKAIEGLDYS
jgi:integrase